MVRNDTQKPSSKLCWRLTIILHWVGVCLGQPAPAQPKAAPTISVPSATSGLPDVIQVALISAFSALFAVILKDLLFKLWEERRTRRTTLDAVYARYADPLASAAVSLMWRLNEALNEPGRGRWLLLKGVPIPGNRFSTFGAYKKVSTLYRLAVLLGWLRACRREFSYLKLADEGANRPIDSAISAIEKALADGPQVELERFQQLCALWLIQVTGINTQQTSLVSVDLEAAIASYLEASDKDELTSLDDRSRRELCQQAAQRLCSSLNVNPISSTVVDQTWGQAFEIIAVREAWIYRDWQAAIGDLMIRDVEHGDRRFDVIGFSEFESVCLNGTDDQKKWVSRLSAIFDEIDVSVRHRFDHRPKQLGAILRATALLVESLSESGGAAKQISGEALKVANLISKPTA